MMIINNLFLYALFSDKELSLRKERDNVTSVLYFLPYFSTLDILFNIIYDLYNYNIYIAIISIIFIEN